MLAHPKPPTLFQYSLLPFSELGCASNPKFGSWLEVFPRGCRFQRVDIWNGRILFFGFALGFCMGDPLSADGCFEKHIHQDKGLRFRLPRFRMIRRIGNSGATFHQDEGLRFSPQGLGWFAALGIQKLFRKPNLIWFRVSPSRFRW